MRTCNRLGWVLAALGALLLGCGDDDATVETRRGVTADAGGVGHATAGAGDGQNGDGRNGDGAELSNDQIAGVMIAANGAEQSQGELAMDAARDPRVRAFATRMYTEHAAANQALAALIETTSLEWGVSPLGQSVSDAAERGSERLAGLHSDAFDHEYVAAQYAAHAQLLAIVDSELLPAVTNPLLESELVSMRQAAATHLVEAGSLRDDQVDAGAGEP